MSPFSVPYGKSFLKFDLPDQRVKAVLTAPSHSFKPAAGEAELVLQAFANPIGSLPLCELAKGKRTCTIVASDHTRPVPSHIIMPLLLAELRKGNPDLDITILLATGMHRESTHEDIVRMFGEHIANTEHIVNHVARDDDDMVDIGTLPSGGKCMINKIAAQTDLLVAEGFIEPHLFAGFSGGRKAILPGISSQVTVMANHCAEFIDSPKARTGILEGNPIHKDMLYAAKAAKLAFIINVVIDADKHIIAAFAGDREKAHEAGTAFLSTMSGVDAAPADIVITTNGGFPMDLNLYQSVKGMTAGEATCKDGGVIIMASSAVDGHGAEDYYQTLKHMTNIQAAMDDILSRKRNETQYDQWAVQILLRMLLHFTIIMVTDAPQSIVEDMHLKYAPSVEAALQMADELLAAKGIHDGSITVIPDGVAVYVR